MVHITPRRHKKCRRHPPCRCRQYQLLFISAVSFAALVIWNESFVQNELEAPLDHIAASLLKPIYRYNQCPLIEARDDTMEALPLPPMFMVSARPRHMVLPIINSWNTRGGFPVEVISTANYSKSYRNKRCRIYSWKSRLFGVYQMVFQQFLLRSNHNSSQQQQSSSSLNSSSSTTDKLSLSQPLPEYLVTVEDDVILIDPQRFRQELYWAIQQQVGYYSFYNPRIEAIRKSAIRGKNISSISKYSDNYSDGECIYESGAVAQIWSRHLLEQVVQASNDTYCRLPIDMFVAQQGPWYVTQHRLVKHIGQRVQYKKKKKKKVP